MADKRVNLSMSVEDANDVDDALSYYLMAAADNYGAGYQRDSEYDQEERRQYEAVKKVSSRLHQKLETLGYI